ncbi:D-alanine--D-alanine ligase [Cytobacillus firmus]|uniref:D-alanine--D-alanine ligase n=1 Tax=Cytobacillus firmus TaxID=1399 RepID=A0A800MXG0_CYTFI|nr:D-alanine--D-alanine ligase [Cytobacillus firmus]KAF0824281.1 D-alanine--D-alanine ligase [Cytobacillus firmus]
MKVGVIYGGLSVEREVSIKTGKNMINALKSKDYDVKEILINDETDYLKLINEHCDIFLIGLHGGAGENGSLQALLDFHHITYVGSNMASSCISMDKWKTKQILKNIGIPVAEDLYVLNKEEININEIVSKLTFPIVAKPNNEGSSIGLTIIKNQDVLEGILKNNEFHDGSLLLEEYISGKEVTVGVIGELGMERALPVVEIVPDSEFYDYKSKYVKGKSKHIIPAALDTSLLSTIQDYAVKTHRILECKTYSRVDFIIDTYNIPKVLEINTLPGMTDTSLFPDAIKSEGVNYPDMIELLLYYEMKNFIKINEHKKNLSNNSLKKIKKFKQVILDLDINEALIKNKEQN